jgi:hypothetical protein
MDMGRVNRLGVDEFSGGLFGHIFDFGGEIRGLFGTGWGRRTEGFEI